jgi:hypothetical protein
MAADAGNELGYRSFKLVEIYSGFDDVIDTNVLRHEDLHPSLLRFSPQRGYVRVTMSKVQRRLRRPTHAVRKESRT